MKVRTGHAINQSSRYIRIFTETRVDVSLSLCQWRLYRGRDWEASAFGWVHAPISYQPILTRSASKSISSKARLPYFFYTRNNMDGRMDDWSHFLSSFIFWDLLHVLHFPFVVVAVFYIHLDEFAAAWAIFSRCLIIMKLYLSPASQIMSSCIELTGIGNFTEHGSSIVIEFEISESDVSNYMFSTFEIIVSRQ